MTIGIFAKWAPVYRSRGLEPRPIKPGTKACMVKDWQKPDAELDPAILESWITKYASFGIGLRMGTPLPGGGRMGALDVDLDDYARLGRALLCSPPSGRIGSKGAVFFVRVIGDLGNPRFEVDGLGLVAECLFDRKLCVIPPTIHPDTKRPYDWIGTPLYELNFDQLPVIGE